MAEGIRVYTQIERGNRWLEQYRGQQPILACILGFTATALIPGISAAGATPEDRKYTAIADAEFLVNGVTPQPQYPLPPLIAGASPVLISRAVVEAFDIPVYLFNAGLPHPPAVPAIDLGGVAANCLSSGDALPLETVKHLFEQGYWWGEALAAAAGVGYLIIAECVVGGTTTALSILKGLGIDAAGKVNSSHPRCNHTQKWEIVQQGLRRAGLDTEQDQENPKSIDPFRLVAAVGDPMQIVAAGMAIAAMRSCGVLLAGGTQMLAVYALARALSQHDTSVSQSDQNKGVKAQETYPTTVGRCPRTSLSPNATLSGSVLPYLRNVCSGRDVPYSYPGLPPCNANPESNAFGFCFAVPAERLYKFSFQSPEFWRGSQPLFCRDSPSSFSSPVSPLIWQPSKVVVGTTRWVAEDPTGDTVGLAQDIGDVPLLATQLSFAKSGYPQLQAYEQGYVKEGVGAGGCAIAAHLYKGWNTVQLLQAIDALVERYCQS